MNKASLKAAMVEYGDTQETLASAMGISLSRLNAKINERNGATFTQSEMRFIISRYQFDEARAMRVFFADMVS